ncbi:MAG: class II fructose-bisphosphate aldolase [Alphaproteobacteria bacterium]
MRRAPTVVFHSLDDARAALAAARETGAPLTLTTAPGAAAYAGVQYLKAIVDRALAEHPDVSVTAVIDCGDDAGTAQGALRIGWKALRFSGPTETRRRIADIAGQCGARLVGGEPDEAALDLLDLADPKAACRAFFAGRTD